MRSHSLARQVLDGGNAIELHDGNKNGAHVSYWHKSQFKYSVTSLELMEKKKMFVNWGFKRPIKAKCDSRS